MNHINGKPLRKNVLQCRRFPPSSASVLNPRMGVLKSMITARAAARLGRFSGPLETSVPADGAGRLRGRRARTGRIAVAFGVVAGRPDPDAKDRGRGAAKLWCRFFCNASSDPARAAALRGYRFYPRGRDPRARLDGLQGAGRTGAAVCSCSPTISAMTNDAAGAPGFCTGDRRDP